MEKKMIVQELPKPSRITKDQAKKIAKTALYLAVSAVVSYLITLTTQNPELFGPLTVVVNLVLVFLKQVFTEA
jgi:fatty acid desaturase